MADPDPKKKPLPLAPGGPAKRKLPVLPNDDFVEEGDADRPPWHWSAIGAVAIFVIWLPLTFLTAAAGKRLLAEADAQSSAQIALAGLNLVAFALAALGGGALVGRFGGKAGLKEATVAGFATAAIAWAAIAFQGAGLGFFSAFALLAVLAAIGAGVARTGGWLGLRQRRP